ncbi:MAG: hypothetical protein HZB18_09230 [Chloroflexi bacterium]|nr:hypothetical protein [Chloroflexota bacterium]
MKFKTTILIMIAILLISACGGGEAEATQTPTLDPKAIETNAVATFANGLTQTALAAPTETPAPTNTLAPLPTLGLLNTITPLGTIVPIKPTASCYAMSFVADISIPDNTSMTPGQAFTKTWKVKNTGSCAWDAGFKFAFTGGNAMNGTTFTLPQSVAANAETEISVAMTAPATAGTARGNWRMSTAGGQFFGDEVYLVILVGGAAATSTATNTSVPATETPTSTPTP